MKSIKTLTFNHNLIYNDLGNSMGKITTETNFEKSTNKSVTDEPEA